ncbi:hypothetical protein MBLNU459_g4651t2 [Dothideomycetes sp. NU459]
MNRITTNVDQKLVRDTRFPPEFSQKVDTSKINIQIIKNWAKGEVARILNNEDDIVEGLLFGLIETKNPDIKSLQIQLTGFLGKDAAPFCKELWNLLLDAQKSTTGVPQQLLQAKVNELQQQKVERAQAAEAAQRRRDEDRARDRELEELRRGERNDHAEATAVVEITTADHAEIIRGRHLRDIVGDLMITEEDQHLREKPTLMFLQEAIAGAVMDEMTAVTVLLPPTVGTREEVLDQSGMRIEEEITRRTPEGARHPGSVAGMCPPLRQGNSVATISDRAPLRQVDRLAVMYKAVTINCHHAADDPLHHLKSTMRVLMLSRTDDRIKCRAQTQPKVLPTVLAAAVPACLTKPQLWTRHRLARSSKNLYPQQRQSLPQRKLAHMREMRAVGHLERWVLTLDHGL